MQQVEQHALPPIPSVARRGEWSMGKVIDVYWHFSEPGDNYLGRVLAGLNALSPEFNVLPPHFDMESPLDDPYICEAMELMFGPIYWFVAATFGQYCVPF